MRRWVAAGVVLAVLGWVSACGGVGPADLSAAQRAAVSLRAPLHRPFGQVTQLVTVTPVS